MPVDHRLRLDVDRVELADSALVAAGADGCKPRDDVIVDRDERRPAGRRLGDAPAPALGPDEAAPVELARRKDVPVRRLPRPLLHVGDPVGVGGGCDSDLHEVKGRVPRREVRARPRRGGRPDGRRDRTGRRRVRAPRLAARSVPRRGRAGTGRDREEPRKARRRRRGNARADRACRRSRRCGADDRGDHRGRRGQGRALPPRRRRPARRSDPRLEHELDPDHVARGGDVAARPGDRHALLQPGAGAEARRGDPRGADLGRHRRGDRRAWHASSARSRRKRTTSPASCRTAS